MKILITGITGFVGANFTRFLLKKGVEVHGIIRKESNLWRLEDVKEKITFHKGNILNKNQVEKIISSVKPDYLYHFAIYGADSSEKDEEQILMSSLFSSLHIFNSAINSGIKKIINIGSSSEYGTKNHPMKESEIIVPNSIYSIGKSAQTHLASFLSISKKIPIITFRLFSVYGPFEESNRFIINLIKNAINNTDMPLNDPKIARDFIFIDDVSELLYKSLQYKKNDGPIFNLGSGKQSTLGQAYKETVKILKSKTKPIIGSYEKRQFDTNTWVADMKKTLKEFKWKPKYNLRIGLKKTVEWYKEHKNLYEK